MKASAKAARGRRPKTAVWKLMPRAGVCLSLHTANEFRDRIAKTYVPERVRELYQYWYGQYIDAAIAPLIASGKLDRSKQRIPFELLFDGYRHKCRRAAGIANKATAKKYPGDAKRLKDRETRIGQIIKEVEDSAEQLVQFDQQETAPLMQQYNTAVVRLRLGKKLLNDGARSRHQAWPNREGLWPDCVLTDLRTAPVLSDLELAFLLEPKATARGSPQRLISSLAAALLDVNANLQATAQRAIAAEKSNTEIKQAIRDAYKKGFLVGNYLAKLKDFI
jgi:hypothetical protein